MTVLDSPPTPAVPPSDEVRLQRRGVDVKGRLFLALVGSLLGFALLVLAVLLVTIWIDGWGWLTDDFWAFMSGQLSSRAEETGIFKALRGTFWMGVFTAVIAFPAGIAAAIYLEEYAPQNRLTNFITVNIRNLAGVPSVVFGILGFAVFVELMGGFDWLFWGEDTSGTGRTTAAAGVTLAVLVLPIVIITSAEAIRSVPQGIKEAAYGVGATKSEAIRHHILPYAAPGILTGTLLSLAQALGQAAPLILVGAVQGRLGPEQGLFDLSQLSDQFTAMPIFIAVSAGRPGQEWVQVTAAAIIVLLAMVLTANAAAILLRNRFEKKRAGA